MPAIGREHERPVLGPERRLGELHCIVEDPLVQLLAARVQGLELAGDRGRFGGVIGEQQPQPFGRLADAAGGVQAGGEDEPHVPRLDRPPGEPRCVDQRAQPRPPRIGEHLQAVAHEDAVLAGERDHVRHGRERHVIEEVERQVGRLAERRHQRLGELEGDPSATQVLVFGRTGRAARVEHGGGRRQLVAREVVIGDDDVDPGFPRRAHRLHGGNSAVARDDQAGAYASGLPQAGLAEIVTVPQAMRHERLDLRAYAAQHAGEQRRRALAVHVVVAVHQDRHGGAHGARHELDRALHVEPGEGVGEALEAGPEERFGALGSREPALHQDGGQGLGDMELVGERGREPGIRRRGDRPAGGDHSLA